MTMNEVKGLNFTENATYTHGKKIPMYFYIPRFSCNARKLLFIVTWALINGWTVCCLACVISKKLIRIMSDKVCMFSKVVNKINGVLISMGKKCYKSHEVSSISYFVVKCYCYAGYGLNLLPHLRDIYIYVRI